jgi:hypothetical protein
MSTPGSKPKVQQGSVKNKATGYTEKQPVAKKMKPTTPSEPSQQKYTEKQPRSKPTQRKDAIQRSRITFLFLNLIGQLVEVQVLSGEIFEGIFHGTNIDDSDDSFSIVLLLARLKPLGKKTGKKGLETHDTYIINGNDIAQIHAKAILFAPEKEQYRDESK